MIKQDENWEELYLLAKKLDASHLSYEEIEKQLSEKTDDQQQVAEMIRQLKKVKHAVKHKSGLMKLAIGSFFLVTGFLITCINFHNNTSFSVIMYSFTIIGLVFLFAGLYDIIG